MSEQLSNDWFIEKLGASQQKVMSLTVQNRALKKKFERVEALAEVLEELVMDVVADCREGLRGYEIEARIAKVMQKLDGEGL
jgi:hypothetical protein